LTQRQKDYIVKRVYFIDTEYMENKKLLLIKVITKLQGHRDLADGILALLETADIDEKTIDGIIKVISASIKQVNESKQKTLLEKSLTQVHRIQEMEIKEHTPEEELEHILDELE